MTEYADVYELLAAQTGAVLFDIDDTTSLRTVNAVTGNYEIPVDGDPVDLMLDVSGTGGQTMAAKLASQPELVTNGTFDTDVSGWTTQGSTTATWSSGVMVVDHPVAGTWYSEHVRLVTPILTVGKFYSISFSARVTAGTNSLRLANNATPILDMPTISSTFQTFSVVFQATVTNTFSFFKNGGIGTFELDNISVKEIPGHAAIVCLGASECSP